MRHDHSTAENTATANPTTESRFPLHLTARQLNDLKVILDAATASEADPDAEIFELMDQVRAACRQAAQQAATEANCRD